MFTCRGTADTCMGILMAVCPVLGPAGTMIVGWDGGWDMEATLI